MSNIFASLIKTLEKTKSTKRMMDYNSKQLLKLLRLITVHLWDAQCIAHWLFLLRPLWTKLSRFNFWPTSFIPNSIGLIKVAWTCKHALAGTHKRHSGRGRTWRFCYDTLLKTEYNRVLEIVFYHPTTKGVDGRPFLCHYAGKSSTARPMLGVIGEAATTYYYSSKEFRMNNRKRKMRRRDAEESVFP